VTEMKERQAADPAERGTSRSDLAQDRTDLAEDRTLLAHERSFAGWVRTGMAAVGIGVGFNALFQTLEPAWAPKAIASIFLWLAVFMFLSAERRACRSISRLEAHKIAVLAPIRLRLMTWILTAATVALGIVIWVLA
jgi:putative membrane protein